MYVPTKRAKFFSRTLFRYLAPVFLVFLAVLSRKSFRKSFRFQGMRRARIYSDTNVVKRFRERQGRSIIYFMHMKKAGGTALCSTMQNAGVRTPRTCNCEICFGPNKTREKRLEGSFSEQHELYTDLRDATDDAYEFVATERPMPVEFDTRDDRPWLYVTNLRHPIEAYWSHYLHVTNYVKRARLAGKDVSQLPSATVSYALKPFKKHAVEDRLNFVPGRLIFALTGVHSAHEITQISKLTGLSVAELCTQGEDEMMRILLREAKERLRYFSAILIRDTFQADFDAFSRKLGIAKLRLDSSRSSNNTKRRIFEEDFYTKDAELRAVLHQTFKYDIELYEYGVELARDLRTGY